jgi:plasmid maintenance system antidote protein VapI
MKKLKELSVILGLGKPFLSMLLNGKRKMSYRIAKRLKDMTMVRIEFWMEATPEELREAFDKFL